MAAIAPHLGYAVARMDFKADTVKEVNLRNMNFCRLSLLRKHVLLGICREKCLNGGKCVQKDLCECSKGYYGLRCEYC